VSGRRGPLIAGLALIVVGGLLLAGQVIPSFEADIILPIASVILGAALIILSVRPARPKA
jgi:predicted regulator of Ras-like GTPase activity (Roadblock/LC7/MglB family)